MPPAKIAACRKDREATYKELTAEWRANPLSLVAQMEKASVADAGDAEKEAAPA